VKVTSRVGLGRCCCADAEKTKYPEMSVRTRLAFTCRKIPFDIAKQHVEQDRSYCLASSFEASPLRLHVPKSRTAFPHCEVTTMLCRRIRLPSNRPPQNHSMSEKLIMPSGLKGFLITLFDGAL